MKETVLYSKFEEHLESFPAENYVDYMTNVMTVPERHTFYFPKRGCTIICETQLDIEGASKHLWRLINEEVNGADSEKILMDVETIDQLVQSFQEFQRLQTCEMCDEKLGSFIRKMS
jgi:hypothetical protein